MGFLDRYCWVYRDTLAFSITDVVGSCSRRSTGAGWPGLVSFAVRVGDA